MNLPITGKVLRGDGYGRKLGFPTVNLDRREFAKEKMKPPLGVYAGLAFLHESGKIFKAAIVLGPLNGRNLPKIEAHILGFSGNLYGKKVTLHLGAFLRPFKKFRTEALLVAQIKKDVQLVRRGNNTIAEIYSESGNISLAYFKKHSDWVKVWSGKWSLHTCTQFGGEWTEDNKVSNDSAYGLVVYVSRKGISDCWVSQTEKDYLGNRLISELADSTENAKKITSALKDRAGRVLSFIKEKSGKRIDRKIYDEFWKRISDYYLPHLSVKYIVDYLSPDGLKKFLPILEEARLYSEPIFREEENFMEKTAEQVANEAGYTVDQILCTTKDELRAYFDAGKLPDKKLLNDRFAVSIQFFAAGKYVLYSGKEAEEKEKIVLPKSGAKIIKGQTAHKGRAKGMVRLVIDPFKYKGPFEKGDILVTGMTRPEFLPLMEKAAAFITDAGGILSHAAIVAREMKKPCIIGTKIATKALKDGDMVEVDADKGVVRIIK